MRHGGKAESGVWRARGQKSSAQVPRLERSTRSGHLRQKEVYVNLFPRQGTHRRASIIGPAEIMQELSESHAKYVLRRGAGYVNTGVPISCSLGVSHGETPYCEVLHYVIRLHAPFWNRRGVAILVLYVRYKV